MLWQNPITKPEFRFRGGRGQTMFHQSQNFSFLFVPYSKNLTKSQSKMKKSRYVLKFFIVLMKPSWACSWSSHAHVRVKASRARPQLDNMLPGLVALSIMGNTLAISKLLRKRMRKKRTTTLFLHLTMADCLVTIFPMAGRLKVDGLIIGLISQQHHQRAGCKL